MIFNFTGVMIAEMYASRTGIGHLIANWGENFQMPQLFAGVILLAVGGDRLQRDRALAGGAMQHVANLSELRQRERRRCGHRGGGPLATSTTGREGEVPALEDISLTVGAGRFVVIVGPSGCGKTSLLMMMAGLRHQTSGTILCAGPADRRDPIRIASASCSRRRACFPGSPRSTTSSFR